MKISEEPSPAFRHNLRQRLLALAQTQKLERKSKMSKIIDRKSLWGLASMLAVLGLAVILQTNTPNPSAGSLGEKVSQRQAFGRLPSLEAKQAATKNAGGEAAAGNLDAELSGRGSAGMSAPSPTVLRPEGDEYLPPKVTYLLKAEFPKVPEELWVYRESGLQAGREFMQFLGEATGLEVFERQANAMVESISLTMPNSNYRYNVDQFGRFSMWANHTLYDASLKQPPMPSDAELIAIANNFIDEQGLNRNAYEAPYVEGAFQKYYYLKAGVPEADRMIWPPMQITVNYDMALDGKKVVSFNAAPDPGLSVNVNIATKKVDGLSGRWTSSREKSLYPASSLAKIKEHALRGGLNPIWGWLDQNFTPEQEAKRKKIEVDINQIELGYLQQYKYDNLTSGSQSFWIPVYALTGSYLDENGSEQSYGTIVPAIDGNFFEDNPYQILPMGSGTAPAIEVQK